MKKLVCSLVLGSLAMTSCDIAPQYKISGNVDTIADNSYVYLLKGYGKNASLVDSALVHGGKFAFQGRQDTAEVHQLLYKEGNRNKYGIEFFLENGNLTVTLGTESTMSGTPHNDILQNFNDQQDKLVSELRSLYSQLRKDTVLTQEQREALEEQFNNKEKELNEMVITTIDENISNPLGAYLIPMYSYNYELSELKKTLAKIPEEYKSEGIERLQKYVQNSENTAIGQKFTDFTMKTPEGKEVKLSDFVKNNTITLVDFWASWCGPCRAEMPNVVKAYKAYKRKGFGIVGVSLDSSHERWTKAIKDLHMDWPQMSDLKSWNCEGADLYGVKSIPSTVLINQDGIIIDRDLRGANIEKKLQELLK